jgi:hypothetical protein
MPRQHKRSRTVAYLPVDVWEIIAELTCLDDLASVLFINKQIQHAIITAWRTPEVFEHVATAFFRETDKRIQKISRTDIVAIRKEFRARLFTQLLMLFKYYGYSIPEINEKVYSLYALTSMSIQATQLVLETSQFGISGLWKYSCAVGGLDVAEYLTTNKLVTVKNSEYIDAIDCACYTSNIPMIQYLLGLNHEIPIVEQLAMFLMAKTNANTQVQIYQILLEDSRFDPSTYFMSLLSEAIETEDSSLLKFLLQSPHYSPSQNGDFIFGYCCQCGKVEHVKVLLEDRRSDPTVENAPLFFSTLAGHTTIVKMLLEDGRVAPSHGRYECIVAAARLGHYEIMKLFLQDGRVGCLKDAVQAAKEHNHDDVVLLIKNYTDSGH